MKNSLSPTNLVARSAAFVRALVSSLSPPDFCPSGSAGVAR